jgi:hypothetical protein
VSVNSSRVQVQKVMVICSRRSQQGVSGVSASVMKLGLSKDSKARGEGFSESRRGRVSDATQLLEDSKVEGC